MGIKAKLVLFLTVSVCISLLFVPYAYSSKVKSGDWVGKTFYLGINVWFEHPEKIYSTNYHKGLLLNAGEKVKILKVSEREVVFSSEGDITKYTIIYVRKHHSNVKMDDILKRTFLVQDPLKSAKYRNFTKEEKEHIKNGTIGIGMRKEAVLMTYGYPPDHRTPSLDNNTWLYWNDRFRYHTVTFDTSGKVEGIQ